MDLTYSLTVSLLSDEALSQTITILFLGYCWVSFLRTATVVSPVGAAVWNAVPTQDWTFKKS